MRIINNTIYFYGTSEPFSNWYKCDFKIGNITFNCSEQALMYSKASYFKDIEIAEEILKTRNQKRQKELGRMVSNYIDEEWSKVRENIMTEILKKKFNSDELKYLKDKYKGYKFVEASPYDKIWGVGLSQDDNQILDKKNWKGKNLLGKCMTKVFEGED